MSSTRLLHTAVIGAVLLAGTTHARDAWAQMTVSEVALPGGVRAALSAIGDRIPPDRAQFLTEFIRHTYDMPIRSKDDLRAVALRSLVAELEAGAKRGDPSETLPLPLSDRIWIDVVFGGRVTPRTLVGAILQSRSAALFYCGLLSLDDETREWLGGRPDLVAELASKHAAAFLAAAPGLRISGGSLRLPGGEPAAPVWEALVGRRPDRPADFARALVASADGTLAYFFGDIAQLTPPQIRLALNLESSDAPPRIDSARRLYAVFQRLRQGRSLEEAAFTRPTLDPALLVAELNADRTGRPLVPGTRGLWRAVFGEDGASHGSAVGDQPGTPDWKTPADFTWLCEQVFRGEPGEQRRRYMMVLFGSRHLGPATSEAAADAIDAIRAAASYPALTTALERAGATTVSIFASAARRAYTLSAIEDDDRAVRALAQFQGALALVTRAASRGSITAGSASALISSLSAVAVSDRGEYEGRLVGWLSGWMKAEAAARAPASSGTAMVAGSAEDVFGSAAGPMEQRVLRVLAGPSPIEPPLVEWEGTRYRLDLARAEAERQARALGDSPRPYLSSAAAIVGVASALEGTRLTRDEVAQQAQTLARAVQAVAADGDETSNGALHERYSTAQTALQRAADAGDIGAATRLPPALRLLADDLLARGLMEMAYAAALGPRDGVSISAADAARRHNFGLRPGAGRSAPWRPPLAGADSERRWRVAGSLLGLDVELADFSLVRLSPRPLARRPSLNEIDRRVFIEAVALVQPVALTDADRDRIVAAIRDGRAKLDAARTSRETLAIADEIGLSAPRRTLLSWTVAHDPERVATFLSPSELLWLGLGNVRVDALRSWGASAGSRRGCLCLEVVDRRPWESFAGRWQSGMMASAFPDLNLRLAELLSELRMPAALLGPVLTSATLDFVDTVISRDPDDRRGLVEFVQALGSDRLEQYLALLTTDGPMVPLGAAAPGRDVDSPGPAGVPRVIRR